MGAWMALHDMYIVCIGGIFVLMTDGPYFKIWQLTAEAAVTVPCDQLMEMPRILSTTASCPYN